jgi:hypothetical protein
VAQAFPAAVYVLCFLTSAACGLLLTRNYRRTGARLLLWSGLCFLLLAANNLTVIVDLLILPGVDLQMPRLAFSLSALMVLLFGFVWDLEN